MGEIGCRCRPDCPISFVVIAVDPETAWLIAEAERIDNEARRRHEEFETRQAEREQAQARTEIVYKTYEPPMQQQQAADLDPATQARWDSWLDHRVMNTLDAVIEVIAEEMNAREKALVDAILKLREEIGAVRAEVEILRQHKASKDAVEGNVTPIKGRSDAA